MCLIPPASAHMPCQVWEPTNSNLPVVCVVALIQSEEILSYLPTAPHVLFNPQASSDLNFFLFLNWDPHYWLNGIIL